LPSNSVDIALYINAASFLFATLTIRGLNEIPIGAKANSIKDETLANHLLKDGMPPLNQKSFVVSSSEWSVHPQQSVVFSAMPADS
jgi:hypothetical protein